MSTVSAGFSIKFRIEIPPSSGSHIITENASDTNIIRGGFSTAEITNVSDCAVTGGATNINFGTSAVNGDWCTLEADGVIWYLHGWTNQQAGVTIT